MNEPTSIADLSEADRIAYARWLDQYVSPLTYSEEEIDELARLDAMRRKGAHEL